tara:strand:- start:3753 stop:4418 length:666 start_codon:yes stop_codon:yes gene_type:complete
MIDIKKQNKEGVYFALSRNGKLAKVGASSEPEARRYAINTRAPFVNMGIVAMFGAGNAGSATPARDLETMAQDWLVTKGYRLHLPESDVQWEWFGQHNSKGKAIKLRDLAELACYCAEAAQTHISADEFAANKPEKIKVLNFEMKFKMALQHFQKYGDLFYARHMSPQPRMTRMSFYKMGGPQGYELCLKVKQARGVHYALRLVTTTGKPNSRRSYQAASA